MRMFAGNIGSNVPNEVSTAETVVQETEELTDDDLPVMPMDLPASTPDDAEDEEVPWVLLFGSLLTMVWGSLRFSDVQRMCIKTLCYDGESLRGMLSRTKVSHKHGVFSWMTLSMMKSWWNLRKADFWRINKNLFWVPDWNILRHSTYGVIYLHLP